MLLTEVIYRVVIDEGAELLLNFVMVIITLLSAAYAAFAYNHQRNRSKKDAACKLAEHYANVILEEHGFISNVYAVIGLDSYIRNTIDINMAHDFDDLELQRILKKKGVDRADFLRKIDDIEPKYILKCRLIRVRDASDRIATYDEFIEHNADGSERIKNAAYLKMDLDQDINDLLNQLEYFCMNCRYGLADEEILYQSLHQTFISLVWILYPIISKRNTSNEDKMYTNVIWLFLKWRKRLSNIKENAKKKRKSMEKKARAAKQKAESKRAKAHLAEAEADIAEEKAKTTKAEVHSGKRLK